MEANTEGIGKGAGLVLVCAGQWWFDSLGCLFRTEKISHQFSVVLPALLYPLSPLFSLRFGLT